MNVGLSIVRGMVASINPCAFVLLPTYLIYFLGIEATAGRSQRASVRRALFVAGSVSAGFLAVFLVAGVIAAYFTNWLTANAKYVTIVIAVALIALGVAMLFGFKIPIATPTIESAGRDRTVRSMFVYGIGYALASLGCTIGFFTATVFSAPDSFGAGVVNVIAYGAGMALVVTALTVSLATANQVLVKLLRSGMRWVNLLSGAFMVLAGVYLAHYFWVVDVKGETSSVTSAVERFNNRVIVWVQDRWEPVAIVFALVVVAAVLYVLRRRSPRVAEVPSPTREHVSTEP